MLTRQVKVKLDREVDRVVTRLSRRDSGAKGALIRRIALAAARGWERNGSTARSADLDTDLFEITEDVAVKVWFSEDDLHLLSRMAEVECVSVAQCVRRAVAIYVRKLTTERPSGDSTRSR
jgi:hypothetical protein